MFLSEPPTTRYDLNFSMFGFPVRVHPAFFVFPLVLFSSVIKAPDNLNPGVKLLVLLALFFVSILIHELGHAFAFRYFGQPCRIVLYWMGGLAIPDSGGGGSWMPRSNVSMNPSQQIIISLAGPVFGFLLAALLIGIVLAIGGDVIFEPIGPIPMFWPILPESIMGTAAGTALELFLRLGILINIFLNVLNLAPVYPLDGGQVARQLFIMNDPWNGLRYSMILSIAFAGLIALIGFANGEQLIAIFFAFMAYSNYVTLQQMGGGGYGGRRPW